MIVRKDMRVGISHHPLIACSSTPYIKAHDFTPMNGE